MASRGELSATPSVAEVLENIRRRGDIYCQPTPQDAEGTGIRFGPGEEPIAEAARSEPILPPFVLGPRRQVDALMRQLYLALPAAVRADTAFVIADRLVQEPEAYARYLQSRKRVVIAGSFVGLGAAASVPDWALERHANERWMLRMSILLVRALGREVSDVVYAMGDSPSPAAPGARSALEARLRVTLDTAGLASLSSSVTWGADETIAMAFARALPVAKVRVIFENPAARQHYDGDRRTDEIVAEKLPATGLVPAAEGHDFEVAVFGRREGGVTSDWQARDAAQQSLDADFMARFAAYDSAAWSRLAIVDGRLFNGAWDRRSVPPRCEVLAFGSWGTFGNSFGMTAAIAKILRLAPPSMRRTLLLESVAHDVIANGYEEAQRGTLRDRVDAALGDGKFQHFAGYDSVAATSTVFRILNDLVAERLPSILPFARRTAYGSRRSSGGPSRAKRISKVRRRAGAVPDRSAAGDFRSAAPRGGPADARGPDPGAVTAFVRLVGRPRQASAVGRRKAAVASRHNTGVATTW